MSRVVILLSTLVVFACSTQPKSDPETREPAQAGPSALGGMKLPPGAAATREIEERKGIVQKAVYGVLEPDTGVIIQIRKVNLDYEGFKQDVVLIEHCQPFAEIKNKEDCRPTKTERIPYHAFMHRLKLLVRTSPFSSFQNATGGHTIVQDALKGSDPKLMERTRLLSEQRADWIEQANRMETWLKNHKVTSAKVQTQITELRTLITSHTKAIESNDSLLAAAEALDGYVKLIMERISDNSTVTYLIAGKDSSKMEFVLLGAMRDPAMVLSNFSAIQRGSFERYSPPSLQFRNQQQKKADDALKQGTALGTVELSENFEIAATEVTQYDYFRIVGNEVKSNPAKFKGDKDCRDGTTINGIAMCPLNPIENLSRAEIDLYISKLNAVDKFYSYRLPTEAEWELAARAGSPNRYAFNASTVDDADVFAWTQENSGGTSSLPVALKTRNGLQLHDVHGNVGELVLPVYVCNQSQRKQQQKKTTLKDPKACSSSDREYARGGSFMSSWMDAQLDYSDDVQLPSPNVGFRLVRARKFN